MRYDKNVTWSTVVFIMQRRAQALRMQAANQNRRQMALEFRRQAMVIECIADKIRWAMIEKVKQSELT